MKLMNSRPASVSAKLNGLGFSLVEVVIAVGIFAVAVLSILGLLLPNTKTVSDQLDAGVAQRLANNIQFELTRFGLTSLTEPTALGNPNGEDKRLFMVATKDGSRVLVTGEDPFLAWNDTYGTYDPATAAYKTVPAADKRTAEAALITDSNPGNPPGIAFRDRYYLIEVTWPAYPQYADGLGFMPLNIRVLWPYRLPNGPAVPSGSSEYDDYDDLPWLVVQPDKHSSLLFNTALTP